MTLRSHKNSRNIVQLLNQLYNLLNTLTRLNFESKFEGNPYFRGASFYMKIFQKNKAYAP